jgi:hypothetical protein
MNECDWLASGMQLLWYSISKVLFVGLMCIVVLYTWKSCQRALQPPPSSGRTINNILFGYSCSHTYIHTYIHIYFQSYIPEVAVYFHDKLLRGCRSKKTSSDLVDAFDSPNYRPLAVAGVHVRIHHESTLPPPLRPLRVHSNWETHILALRMIPGECHTHVTMLCALSDAAS